MNKRWYLVFGIVLIVMILFLLTVLVFFISNEDPLQVENSLRDIKKPIAEEVRSPQNGNSSRTENSLRNIKKPTPEKVGYSQNGNSSLKGGIAIFYRTSMSAVEDRLPVLVEDVNDGGGYATNIRWESSENGVVRYIPSVNKWDVMGTTTSYSYSKGYISSHTIDGRVFLFRHRGSSSTLTELDPKNAQTKGSIPLSDVHFAIVGDDVYFREEIRKDLFDKRTGGGELMVQSLKGGSPKIFLEYGDPSNNGRFYGVANSLVSVLYDFSTDTDSIRIHDLQTGEITGTIYENIPAGSYFEGDDALYEVIIRDTLYGVYRLGLDGNRDLLTELELEEGEKGISIDQQDGKLLIVTYKDIFDVTQILLYDIISNTYEEIPFEPFGSTSSPDYQFVFLD